MRSPLCRRLSLASLAGALARGSAVLPPAFLDAKPRTCYPGTRAPAEFGRQSLARIAIILAWLLGAASFGFVAAAESPQDLRAGDRLEVEPAALNFASRRASRQLVVTATIDGQARDVSHLAQIRSSDERVVRIDGTGATAFAAGDGEASLTIEFAGQKRSVPVNVSHFAAPDPVLFTFETMAVLTKQGCATGSCHGSPQGKAGFALSLFGYDPAIDRRSLTRDGFSRRLDMVQPEESLLLRKPLLELAHVGGKRLRQGETPYETLLLWISEGANVDLPAVECERIVVTPSTDRVLKAPYLTQQLSVLAHYSDGQVRDVTRIATYETSSADLATVDAHGRVTGRRRGQAAISVRYLAHLQSVYFTVIEDQADFVWQAPAEVNVIDTHVNAKLRQLQFLPAETCDDATFVRRLHLDLTGLIPTADEARQFLESKAADKRPQLIDALLASEAFARFWSLKQADLMRVSKTRLKHGRAEAFSDWLVEAQRRDLPYDEFARTLLTAVGDTRVVPEANFFVAIPGPEERTEMTAQLFLGSRLECAKCHNHPYEKWTMRDYYSLGAVFARTTVDQGVVQLAATGETLHPTTKQPVRPWGGADAAQGTDRRGPFAAWLTQPDNPFFARVEVNRIWAHLLGRGIVDPVDDFRSSNPPANGPLLDALAQEFVKGGYRRKRIVQLICNSQTYQRSMATNAFNASDEILFSHARPRLLTAEQLKDAVGTAARTLAPVQAVPAQIAASRAALDQRRAELEADFLAWLEQATADVATRDFWAGGWYAVGPFTAADREQAFGPETFPVDFTATFDEGRRSWRSRPEWNDPEPTYTIDGPKDSTVYLARQIYSREPRTIQVTARGATTIWVNGNSALRQALTRERRIPIELAAGINQLVIKIASRQDDPQFRFRIEEPKPAGSAAPARIPLTPSVIALLARPAAALATESDATSPAQPAAHPRAALDAENRAAIREIYPQMDKAYLAIDRRMATQQQRLDYATQRPYPETQPFMTAFGQPKRETACSCERSRSPTLLQALELLNGTVMHGAVQGGSRNYEQLGDEQLLEELYLSALARFPSVTERKAGQAFLSGAAKRGEAVMDLLWSVLNTREFLFQH